MKDDVTKNSKKYSKRRSKASKPSGRYEETRETRGTTKSERSNDASWYGNNDALLRDAGSYSFNNAVGNTTRITEFSNFDSSITYNNVQYLDYPVPGVMTFKYIPAYGGSQGGLPNVVNSNTPINLAARALYSAVRADNSGAKNYDPSDLMKYLIAMDNALCYHSFLRRIYGLARVYSSVNRYWPRAIIESMNVDFDDIISNLADLRYYINAMSAKINRFCVPGNMPIFLRHYFMNSGVYRDDYSDKSQIYVFTPRWLYAYNETNTPATLDPVDVTDAVGSLAGKLGFSDLIGIMDSIMDPLTASEDIGIISGDLFKRYGLDGSFTLTPIDVDYEVVPQFDDVILSQIQNMTIVGDINKTSITEGTTIGVDAGLLYQTLTSQGGYYTSNLGHVINLFKDIDKIEPADVMEATRLTCHGQVICNSTDARFEEVITECGSELVCSFTIWNLNPYTGLPTANTSRDTQVVSTANAAPIAAAMSAFNQHPMLITIVGANPNTGDRKSVV